MAELIRIVRDCDAQRFPYPGAAILLRLHAGSELPLLRDYDRSYYRVACGGQSAYVAKSCALRIEGSRGETLIAAPSIADAPATSAGAHSPRPLGHGRSEPRAALPPPPPASGRLAVGPQPAALAPAYVPPIQAPPRRIARSGAGSGAWFVTLLRVLFFLFGLGMAFSGIAMIVLAAPSVLSVESSTGAGVALGIGGGVVTAIGLGLVWVTYRSLFQFAVIVAGLVLLFGGFQLLILAIPFSQANDFDIDPARASKGLPAAGISLILLGAAATTVMLLRWLRNPESRARWPEVAKWTAIVYGSLLLLGGSAVASIPAASAGETYHPDLIDAAAIGAAIPFFLLPGAALALHGFTINGRFGSGSFRFLPAWALIALFGITLALGAIVVAVEDPVIWLMSPAHAAAALLPAAFLVALVSRGGIRLSEPIAGLSNRQLWLAFAVGIAVVTMVAGQVDGLIAGALGMALLASSGAFETVGSGTELGDVLANADAYLSRAQEAALLIMVVVIVAPIMEEGLKALGVALILPRHPTRAAALALGVAVGAGFGVTEASLYGIGSLADESETAWWTFMLIRGGATSMHALNTGMLGLALYFGRAQRRFFLPLRLYVAAVLLHGLWNGLAVLAGTRVIFSFEGLTDSQLSWLSYSVLTPLAIVTVTALYLIARRAYTESPKAGDAAILAPAG